MERFNNMQYTQAREGEGGGGLDFEEDLRDIPSGLVVDEQQQHHQQQQQQQQMQYMQAPQSHNVYAPSSHYTQPNPVVSAFAPPPPNASAYSTAFAPPPTPHTSQAVAQPMPPLVPQLDQAPVKRPRGRPRKIPGTESRPVSLNPVARGRPGRPRGSRGRGRGRGGRGRGKRGRASSDEDDGDGKSSDSEADAEGSVTGPLNLQEEMPDDYDPTGDGTAPITKFGRKVSRPKSFVPTNKPTIHRKKRVSLWNPDAHLMCQICKQGHSQPVNKLVICDSCGKGWHQLCHVPNVQEEVVSSDLPWLCRACDVKVAEARPDVDVMKGDWAGSAAYTNEEKREWLERLPLHSLIGYVLSIERKYATGSTTLEIWPRDLTKMLAEARQKRAAEEEERKQREEAAEQESATAGQASESEIGTPVSLEAAPEVPLARTAASVRAAAAISQSKDEPVDDGANRNASFTTAPIGFAGVQQVTGEEQRGGGGHSSYRPIPPFMRQQMAPVPVLQPHSRYNTSPTEAQFNLQQQSEVHAHEPNLNNTYSSSAYNNTMPQGYHPNLHSGYQQHQQHQQHQQSPPPVPSQRQQQQQQHPHAAYSSYGAPMFGTQTVQRPSHSPQMQPGEYNNLMPAYGRNTSQWGNGTGGNGV